MIIFLLLICLSSFYSVLLVHESLHFFVAIFLQYDPQLVKINPIAFKISYTNRNRPIDNLMIASIPAIVLSIVGLMIPLNYYTLILKLSCLVNIFNLLPITADGEIIVLSIIQILKKKEKFK
ncbi:hypothetical protein CKN86_04325 [Carnobacterium divergens]|nr:hypothetical protein [Carnobacterium divergens]TFI63983.1 hypothetical protein CKN62_04360 [Carnobacterium divergens]TFI91146.1 hypothetical protein CKN84_04360 [Carnobacterium divergens]TFJ06013.1 hypothetical protein CKN86_04325 [Carnobacterium divergens]TFJ07661.1 hypothetical protein CKN65_04365 [Carnobacterium divergens]